eukprot:7376899-Prymnesium_polylepis.1
MPGIRRIPEYTNITHNYPSLPESRLVQARIQPPPERGGSVWGGPLPVMWTGFEEGLAAPPNR